jgi:putative DNA primase/helicase
MVAMKIKSGLGRKPKRTRADFTTRKSISKQRAYKESGDSDLSCREVALLYAAEGLPVLPLHDEMMGGLCTCRSADCDKPGMHPRTDHGVRDATTNRKFIEKYWAKWPNAKIGIATGVDAGVIAVVVDGEAGRTSLKKLEGRNTQLPKTVTIRAGKKRLYFFRIGGDARLHHPTKRLGSGITIRGDGRLVVAPYSIHDPDLVRRFVDGRAPVRLESRRPRSGSWI